MPLRALKGRGNLIQSIVIARNVAARQSQPFLKGLLRSCRTRNDVVLYQIASPLWGSQWQCRFAPCDDTGI